VRAPSENRDDHSTRSGADARLTGRQIGWFGILPSPREDTKSVNLRIAIGTSVDLSNNSSLRETTTNPPGSRVCHKSATKTLHYAISVGNCRTFHVWHRQVSRRRIERIAGDRWRRFIVVWPQTATRHSPCKREFRRADSSKTGYHSRRGSLRLDICQSGRSPQGTHRCRGRLARPRSQLSQQRGASDDHACPVRQRRPSSPPSWINGDLDMRQLVLAT
jgi:hypothetical protein